MRRCPFRKLLPSKSIQISSLRGLRGTRCSRPSRSSALPLLAAAQQRCLWDQLVSARIARAKFIQEPCSSNSNKPSSAFDWYFQMTIPRSVVPAITAAAICLPLVLFFLHLMLEVGRIEIDRSNVDGHAVSACIEKQQSLLNVSNVTVDQLYRLNDFCYDTIGSQLKIDQEKIRRDNFLFQRKENVVLLYMVILITLSGVALAGLQLLASYKLAVVGRGELAGGGEVSYSAQQGVSFKSSVVGLMILALSFAFFLVFIVYVYSFTNEPSGSGTTMTPAVKQHVPLNLLPVEPQQQDSNTPANK